MNPLLDSALLEQITTEHPAEWRRDLSWSVQCKCGHLHSEHRPDLKTSSPCGRGGCGCRFMRADYVVFYEHRVVIGRLP